MSSQQKQNDYHFVGGGILRKAKRRSRWAAAGALAGVLIEASSPAAAQSAAPQASGTLPAVVVTGNALPSDEGLTAPTSIGSKVPVSQREIPQSVQVISQQQIEQQNMRTLNDAMRMASGVFSEKSTSGSTNYYARGFPVDNLQIDGVPTTLNVATNDPNLTAYDRVEYLSGPSGLMNSIGGPGGAINLVRKKPTREFQIQGGLGFGNYGNYEQDLDVSGPLNESGSVRGRVAGSLLNQETARDGSHRTDGALYGVLEFDLSADTLLRAGASYDRLKAKDQYTGYPTYSDGRLLGNAKHLFLGADWNRQRFETTNLFADLEHKFGGGWTGRISANYLKYNSSLQVANASGPIDPSTNTVRMQQVNADWNDEQESLDMFVNGPIDLFGRKHQLTFGASYMKDRLFQGNKYFSPTNLGGFTTVDIFDPVIPDPNFTGPSLQRTTTTEQGSVYANTKISLMDPLTLIAGGRITWWSSKLKPDEDNNFLGLDKTADHINGHVTPYAGLIFDIDKHNSLYTSYTEIFQPQTQRQESGELLKPLTGEQYEVGWKGEYLDKRLNTTLALFQLEQKNRAVTDPADPTGLNALPQGKARARGIEATVAGKITPRWDMATSYVYTNTKYLDDSQNTGSSFSAIAPKHLFKLWTNYRLPGSLNQWSVGGDAYVTSGFYNEVGTVPSGRISQGGYAVFGAAVGYDVNSHISMALRVNNIFDRYYYSRLGSTTGGNWVGDPRNVMLTMRVKY